MVNFAGSPFIDLRTDLNSFLPDNLKINVQNNIIYNCMLQIKNLRYMTK